jgi:hypothetical protein
MRHLWGSTGHLWTVPDTCGRYRAVRGRAASAARAPRRGNGREQGMTYQAAPREQALLRRTAEGNERGGRRCAARPAEMHGPAGSGGVPAGRMGTRAHPSGAGPEPSRPPHGARRRAPAFILLPPVRTDMSPMRELSSALARLPGRPVLRGLPARPAGTARSARPAGTALSACRAGRAGANVAENTQHRSRGRRRPPQTPDRAAV